MKKVLVGLALVVSLSSCGVDPSEANRILSSQGYTDITIGDRPWFGCSEDDNLSSKFRAKAPNGQYVNGVICGGLLKGYTVRFD